ncbi:RCC1 domain-containing protein [Candidatus Palauibacter sp.]|uniref:RCC1 domain-containing protein n=1 Tax=Candidatus Palauibacter sp. TaxID=3101350 RepID=UPI003B017854
MTEPAGTPPALNAVPNTDIPLGTELQVEPRRAAFFTRAGALPRAVTVTARLLDSAGVAMNPPSPGVRWIRAERSDLTVAPPRVSSDGLTASVEVFAGRAGRDSLAAAAGYLSAHSALTNWEWVHGSVTGPNWTLPGRSSCFGVSGVNADGDTVRLEDYDYVSILSLDPEVSRVDSLVLSADGATARLCATAEGVGRTRLGVVAWDTTSFRYFGEYRNYYVLQEPLAFEVDAEEWQLGVSQSHLASLRLTDAHGTTVSIDPAWIDSWESSNPSVVTLKAGMVTGTGAGSAEFRADYLGQRAAAKVEVYAITGFRFNQDVVCVLVQRGEVRCWGNRNHPLWGYGTQMAGIVTPTEVHESLDLGGAVARLKGGTLHECALRYAGDVVCWGRAVGGLLGYGNLNDIGDGETPASAGPVPTGGSGRVVDIGGGSDTVCAVYDNGSVRCWGSNHAGQLGLGHQEQINVGDDERAETYGEVLLGGRAVQVAGGRYKVCALLDTGKVRCWGLNGEDWDWRTGELDGRSFGLGYGELGTTEPIGDDEAPSEAGDLELPGRATKVAAGGYHMCALMEVGAVRCWGSNTYGQLGHGLGHWFHIGDDETAAETIPLHFEAPVVDIVAGYWHTCALLVDGSVRCWGLGTSGSSQLGLLENLRVGDDEAAWEVDPVDVGGPVTRIFAFEDGTCAVMEWGGLRCWGYNGGLLGYPFRSGIGRFETPASVGDATIFPGPIPPLSGRPARSAAVATARAGSAQAASLLIVPASRTHGEGAPGGYPEGGPGPLDGPDGVILPAALAPATVRPVDTGGSRTAPRIDESNERNRGSP